MKLFKKVVVGVLCAVIGLLGTACAGAQRPSGGDGPIDGNVDENKQITLKIQSAAPLKSNYQALLRTEAEGTQLYNQALFTQRLVNGFKDKYSNIKLQFIEDGWGDALFQAQQLYIRDYNAGGQMAVDIMIGETYMGYFAENGVFAELDAEKFSDVIEGACADVTVDGKLYGVPMCTGIMGLQYNTDILSEVGIPEEDWVPSTWAELLENCKTVSEYAEANGKDYGGIIMNNVAGMSCAFRAEPFMRAAGGDIVDDAGNLSINSAANLEAFEYLRNLAQYAYGDSLTCDSELRRLHDRRSVADGECARKHQECASAREECRRNGYGQHLLRQCAVRHHECIGEQSGGTGIFGISDERRSAVVVL